VSQQEEEASFEPGDTIFVGNVRTYLFDDHIGSKGIGADIDTVGTEKTALEDILGISVQFELASLVGTKQVNEPAWRSGFIRVDLVDRTHRDALTAFDTLVAGGCEVENVFWFFQTHSSYLNLCSFFFFVDATKKKKRTKKKKMQYLLMHKVNSL
jgi:hypothetical protein